MDENIMNKTNEELEREMQWVNNELPKLEAKVRIYGKIIGETSVETIIRMIETMRDDCALYTYYMTMYNNAYDELERRKQDNAESN